MTEGDLNVVKLKFEMVLESAIASAFEPVALDFKVRNANQGPRSSISVKSTKALIDSISHVRVQNQLPPLDVLLKSS